MQAGYDYEFTEDISDDYICSICHLVMRKPVQTKCGHLFCKACLDFTFDISSSPTCPIDGKLVQRNEVFDDLATERKILSFKALCPNKGCTLHVELLNIQSHGNYCKHEVVVCQNSAACSVKKRRMDMEAHMQQECQYRLVQCDYCYTKCTFCNLEKHIFDCPKVLVTCPNGCGKIVTRDEMISHESDECPLTIAPCNYAFCGCDFKGPRQGLVEHFTNNLSQHLIMTTYQLMVLQEENKKNTKEIEDMKRSRADQYLHVLKEIADSKVQLIHSSTELTKLKKENQNLKKQIEKLSPFNWKIKASALWVNLTLKLSMNSETFYTEGYYGYKIRLSLRFRKARRADTRLAVFLSILRGEYDSMMPWPFNLNISLIFIDQKPRIEDRRNIEMSYTPNGKNSESFKRPTERQRNLSWCFPCLVSCEKLRSENYIVDDTLFLQMSFGEPEM